MSTVDGYIGHIDCQRRCEVPDGVLLVPVPRPRHAWGGLILCPYEDCGAAFLVERTEPSGEVS